MEIPRKALPNRQYTYRPTYADDPSTPAEIRYLEPQPTTYLNPLSPEAQYKSRSSSVSRWETLAHTYSITLLALFTSLVFVLTAWYAQAIFSDEQTTSFQRFLARIFKVEVGSALAILRILQGALTTSSTIALFKAFELVQWALVGQEKGVDALRLLGVSPSTGLLGTMGVVLNGRSRVGDKLWAGGKIVLVVATWSAGILLFVRTSLVTEYAIAHTYDVTAGVGQFNGSYVKEYLQSLKDLQPDYNFTIVPYNIQAIAYNLVGNSMQASVAAPVNESCKNGSASCDSYLFTGGLIMTTPWVPTGYDSSPLVYINDMPALQTEFKRGLSQNHDFTDEECSVFGADGVLIGVKFCVAERAAEKGSYMAGMYVCTNGTSSGKCITTDPAPNITTTFSVYSRKAHAITSRSNYTVLSAITTSDAELNTNIDLPTFRLALSWLLDFNASAIPATSSIVSLFWIAQDQLKSEYWSSELYHTLQSILAFPLWQFNPNNFGNVDLAPKEIVQGLPEEFYTKASITKPYTRIVINHDMYLSFLVLQGVVLAFVWMIPVWLLLFPRRLPQISSYPMLDFAFKAEFQTNVGEGDREEISKKLFNASGKETRKECKNVRVRLYQDD